MMSDLHKIIDALSVQDNLDKLNKLGRRLDQSC